MIKLNDEKNAANVRNRHLEIVKPKSFTFYFTKKG